MNLFDENRPYFCLHALAGEIESGARDMNNILPYLNNAQREPYRAMEFETAAEIVLRNNGFDPNHSRGWKEAGVEDGRAGAVREIRKAYLASVHQLITQMASDAKSNAYEYTPSAIQKHNPVALMMAGFKRAHLGKDIDVLTSDEAWQEAGIDNMQSFQQSIRTIFVDARVGGYVVNDLKLESDFDAEALSVKAADYAIQHAFPELAAKLGIPVDLGDDVLPKQSVAAAAFGQVREPKAD